MTIICPECGKELPDGSEFCIKCGAICDKAVVIDDTGKMHVNYCQKCGHEINEGDMFCAECGAAVNTQQQMMRREPLSTKDMIAMVLAVCGGIFNVFGLGQLVLKRWAKAFLYISLTLLFFYLQPSFYSTENTRFLLMMMRLMVFFFQMMDVFRAIYIVEEQK